MPSPEVYAAKRLAELLGGASMSPESANETSQRPQNRSTGPRTEAGKNRSKLNAWRHGLTGQVAVMPWEDQAAFESFCQNIVNSLYPVTPIESQLAQNIAEDHWRLNRSRAIENNILALGHEAERHEAEGPETDNPEINTAFAMAQTFMANPKTFDLVTLYASRINRDIRNNMAQLKQLQTDREARRATELEEASQLREAHKAQGLPYDDLRDRKNIDEDEDPFAAARLRHFVFSNQQIDHYTTHRSRLTLIKKAA
jgi:hypothetical protein